VTVTLAPTVTYEVELTLSLIAPVLPLVDPDPPVLAGAALFVLIFTSHEPTDIPLYETLRVNEPAPVNAVGVLARVTWPFVDEADVLSTVTVPNALATL